LSETRLSKEQWGAIYNIAIAENVANNAKANNFSIQTKEMLKLTRRDEYVLEIGAGSGETSAALAIAGRRVVAMDYSDDSVSLIKKVSELLDIDLKVIQEDASKELAHETDTFDVVFQAGLLEHFEKSERIHLLKEWGRIGKKVVSIIPNAGCIPYRVGMNRMIANNTWQYGLELPQYSLREEFQMAGLLVDEEYSIGFEHGLTFLPKWDPIRILLSLLSKSLGQEKSLLQGYLLVTVGKKMNDSLAISRTSE